MSTQTDPEIPGASRPADVSATSNTGAFRLGGRDVNPDARWSALRVIASVVLIGLLGMVVASYPLGPVIVGFPLLAYALLIWCAPSTSIPLLLAALPLANLAPITGWLFLTEFDLFLLVTLVVRVALPRQRRMGTDVPGVRWWLLTGVMASALASTFVGLFPLQPLDSNAFSDYYSHYNALRILKGYVSGLVLFMLVRSDAETGRKWRSSVVVGMSLGLSGVVLAALWERQVFPGLLDFSSVYRITSTLFEMHTGGGDVEAYLGAAIPFVVVAALSAPSILWKLFAGCVFVAATYVMGVTYARGGYAGYAVALMVLVVTAVASGRVVVRWVAIAGLVSTLVVISACVALPIVGGSFMQWRFAKVDADTRTRLAHWRDALDLIPATWTAGMFGVGLGSFPQRYFYGSGEGRRPGTYSYHRDGELSFVRLGGGAALYLGQRVAMRPQEMYRLVVEFRSAAPGATLNVPICEKSVLYSYDCVWSRFMVEGTSGGWNHEEVVLDSRDLGRGMWYLRRPVELALANFQTGTLIDVRFVGLYDRGQNDLVRNGTFSQAGDFWFFSVDDHLPWHIKNFFLQLRVEQGWLGVLTVGSLVIVALGRLVRAVGRADSQACATLASISAVLVVGLFNSLLEAPRLMALLVLLLCLGAGWPSSLHPAPSPGSARSS